jgi:lysyl-tRNA synthetase class 2
MTFTEEMISQMVYQIHGTYKIPYHPNGPEDKDNVIEIDFSTPWKRVPLM